ncbi:MBL fold metallo-hydrolase [Hyalangium versicolor]|uniref:MBL fold metallo-hydrolase n=1 Tax=Hyalangium versicolor TaxID=2861190 RepID=UPI001CCCED6E|nr:MBL fold metallo-hydrolase [Hyalangium versicolor]
MRRLPLLLLVLVCGCKGVPQVPDKTLVSPKANTPPLQLCWAETGKTESWGGFATAGIHTTPTWNATASILVIRHPKGTVLIDTGKSFKLEEEKKQLYLVDSILVDQIMAPLKDVATAPEALQKVGEDPSKVKWILLTHAHGDHAGGVADLPGVPVLAPNEELNFIHQMKDAHSFHMFRDQAEALEARAVPLRFKHEPYSIFPESADLFGDGSIVAVPLFGHTPGSIGVFVNAGPNKRIFHVGDIVVVREGYERPARKGAFLGVTDRDPERVAYTVGLLHQLHEKDPTLTILPAHDRDAWQQLFGAEAPTCLPAPSSASSAASP